MAQYGLYDSYDDGSEVELQIRGQPQYAGRQQAQFNDPSMDSMEFHAMTARPPAAQRGDQGFGSYSDSYDSRDSRNFPTRAPPAASRLGFSRDDPQSSFTMTDSYSSDSQFIDSPPQINRHGAAAGQHQGSPLRPPTVQQPGQGSGRPRSPDPVRPGGGGGGAGVAAGGQPLGPGSGAVQPGQRSQTSRAAVQPDAYSEDWEGEMDTLSPGANSPRVPRTTRRKPGQGVADSMQGRLHARVEDALKRQLASWDVSDVCNWIQAIGFFQYRAKFAHNSVDGKVLMKMTDKQLHKDLGVLPLGHRQALLEKIEELKALDTNTAKQDSDRPTTARTTARGPPPPASAQPGVINPEPGMGPGQGKMSVEEQKRAIQFKLDKARNKTAQTGALIEQLLQAKELSEEEAKRLRGQLVRIKQLYAKYTQRAQKQIDPDATIPWIPNNHFTDEVHPERIAGPGEDPRLDETFTPNITRLEDVPQETRHIVEQAYTRINFFTRMENASKDYEKLREELNDLEKEAEMAAAMGNVQAEAEQLAANPKHRKAKPLQGYWVPVGEGQSQRRPKGEKQDDGSGGKSSAIDPKAVSLSNDIKLLERKFKEWGHENPPRDRHSDGRVRVPYKELLDALDDLVDAILTPRDRAIGAFQTQVQSFFFTRNYNITTKGEAKQQQKSLGAMLAKVVRLKGCEKLSDVDKARLRVKEFHAAKKDERGQRIEDVVIKQRKEYKIRVLAGLCHMAEFIARNYGHRKAGDSDESGSDSDGGEGKDQDGDKKGKKKGQKKGVQVKVEWTAHGPFVPNGILERTATSAKSWDMLAKRMTNYKKKVGAGYVTIEQTRDPTAKMREEAFNKDLEKAHQLFRLLGWHHGDPELSEDSTVTNINSLIKRALHVAALRDDQVDMLRDAKARKAELLKDLRLLATRLGESHPERKQLDARIAEVKSLAVEADPLPPVDWSTYPWRDDGLQALQDRELDHQRGNLAGYLANQAHRRRREALSAAKGMTHLHDVTRVDWQAGDENTYDVDDMVSRLNYLDHVVELLGQLPTADLEKLLRVKPSGAEDTSQAKTQSAAQEANPVFQLQMYDARAAKRDRVNTQADKERRALVERNKQKKAKAVALYRAYATRQYVKITDEQLVQRAKNAQDALRQVWEEMDSRKNKISPEEQDEFFRRLLEDIHLREAKRRALEDEKLRKELKELIPFRARPYTAPLGMESRGPSGGQSPHTHSRSPSPGRDTPGQTNTAQASARHAVASPVPGTPISTGSRAATPAAPAGRVVEQAAMPVGGAPQPRPGGGFAYWYATGAAKRPSTATHTRTPQPRPASATPSPHTRPASAGARRPASLATWMQHGDTTARSTLETGRSMLRASTNGGAVGGAGATTGTMANNDTVAARAVRRAEARVTPPLSPSERNLQQRPDWGAPESRRRVQQQRAAERQRRRASEEIHLATSQRVTQAWAQSGGETAYDALPARSRGRSATPRAPHHTARGTGGRSISPAGAGSAGGGGRGTGSTAGRGGSRRGWLASDSSRGSSRAPSAQRSQSRPQSPLGQEHSAVSVGLSRPLAAEASTAGVAAAAAPAVPPASHAVAPAAAAHAAPPAAAAVPMTAAVTHAAPPVAAAVSMAAAATHAAPPVAAAPAVPLGVPSPQAAVQPAPAAQPAAAP